MFKRILVPLDGSRFSSNAVKYAIEIAGQFGSEILLIQVEKPTIIMPASSGIAAGFESPAETRMAVRAASEKDKRNVTQGKRYLSRKAREIKNNDIEASYHVEVGDPAKSILKFARKEQVDTVIMTSHGKGGLKRAVMGSVTDEVIRALNTPVLVIRPKQKGK